MIDNHPVGQACVPVAEAPQDRHAGLSHRLFFASAMLLVGCAWGPGTGFATLAGGEVAASWPAEGRLAPDGRWLTSNGYLLRIAQLTVELGDVALQAPGTAGGGGTFDPANPPAGYSLCHGGHCHRADGALIDYADIQAQMGATGAPSHVATLSVGGTLRLAPDVTSPVAVGGCAPSCGLPRGALSHARLGLRRLSGLGTVEAGPGVTSLGGERPWRLALTLDTSLSGALSDTIDRAGPAAYRLEGRLEISPKLFDGFAWSELAASETIDLAAERSRETLLANLAQSVWRADLVPAP